MPGPSRRPAGSCRRAAGNRWSLSSPSSRYRALPRARCARRRGQPRPGNRVARERRRYAVVGSEQRARRRPRLVGIRRMNRAAEERRLLSSASPAGAANAATASPAASAAHSTPITISFPSIERSEPVTDPLGCAAVVARLAMGTREPCASLAASRRSATGGPGWRLPVDNHFVVVDDRRTRRPRRGNRLLAGR